MIRPKLVVSVLGASIMLAPRCTRGAAESPAPSTSTTPNGSVEVIVVNYELVASQPNRVLVGLVLPDNRFVAYGDIQMRFSMLDAAGQPIGQTSQVVIGSYLPVPGTDPGTRRSSSHDALIG